MPDSTFALAVYAPASSQLSCVVHRYVNKSCLGQCQAVRSGILCKQGTPGKRQCVACHAREAELLCRTVIKLSHYMLCHLKLYPASPVDTQSNLVEVSISLPVLCTRRAIQQSITC